MNQSFFPGLTDSNTEFIKVNDQVLAIHNGKRMSIDQLPVEILQLLEEDMQKNPSASRAFHEWGIKDYFAQLEKYISCRFCGFDMMPDITSCGRLHPDFAECDHRGSCAFEGKICVKLSGPGGELTSRETETLRHIAAGAPEKQIADRLCISQNTVSKHRKSLFNKTGAACSVDLTRFAMNNSLNLPLS